MFPDPDAPSRSGQRDWRGDKLILIRRPLKSSILLLSMPKWSWWLIKSFAALGWSSFESWPDPPGTIYFYFRKNLPANFALVQENYKSLLHRQTLQTFCLKDFYTMGHQRRCSCWWLFHQHRSLSSTPRMERSLLLPPSPLIKHTLRQHFVPNKRC